MHKTNLSSKIFTHVGDIFIGKCGVGVGHCVGLGISLIFVNIFVFPCMNMYVWLKIHIH